MLLSCVSAGSSLDPVGKQMAGAYWAIVSNALLLKISFLLLLTQHFYLKVHFYFRNTFLL